MLNKNKFKKMENLKTQNTNTNTNIFSVINGLGIVENKTIVKSKTPKEKLIDTIDSELRILESRDNLNLKTHKKGDLSNVKRNGEFLPYSKDGIENRFWNNPIGNEVTFNIKYKGYKMRFDNIESNQSFKVENNIETFKSTLKNMRDIINELDDSNSVFQHKVLQKKSK